MPDPSPFKLSPHDLSSPVGGPNRRRTGEEVESDRTGLPVEHQALLARLSLEVAQLRTALDASRHKIARLEVEAAEDPVSGLLNQRAFRREIEKATAFQNQYHSVSSVALISLDGMTGIAERHGQQVVNRLLRTIGDRLRASIRSSDVAARIEPYQFGIVLWNAAACDCDHRLSVVSTSIGGMDRLLEGRVAAVHVRAAATSIENQETPEAILARLDSLLSAKPARSAVRR